MEAPRLLGQLQDTWPGLGNTMHLEQHERRPRTGCRSEATIWQPQSDNVPPVPAPRRHSVKATFRPFRSSR